MNARPLRGKRLVEEMLQHARLHRGNEGMILNPGEIIRQVIDDSVPSRPKFPIPRRWRRMPRRSWLVRLLGDRGEGHVAAVTIEEHA